MVIYVFLFLVPLYFSLFSDKLDKKVKKLFWLIFGVLLTLIIGLRHEIGVDWQAYIRHYDVTVNAKLEDVIFTSDAAYATLNWAVAMFSGKVYTVNLFCSIVFVCGLLSFCQKQRSPGIAFLVALPVLVLIVGMSYTRQSVAVGLEMYALSALIEAKKMKYFFLILIASLFHFSAVFMLSLLAFVLVRNNFFIGLGLVLLLCLIALSFIFQSREALIELYYNQKLSSDGGIYRISLNLIPALCVLFFLNKHKLNMLEYRTWQILSIMSLLFFPLIMIMPTATDRLFIYLIPLQMFVYSNLKLWFINKYVIFILGFCIVLSQFFLMTVWLLYGTYHDFWVPYEMFPFC